MASPLLNKVAQRLRRAPATLALRHAAPRWHALTGQGPAPCSLLLLSDQQAYTSEQQFAPLWRHAGVLSRQLGLSSSWAPVQQALTWPARRLQRHQIVGLKLGFRTPASEAEAITRQLRQALQGSATRLVYFDGDDDPNVQWPAVLGEVDLYVKKHVFADPQAYLRPYIGKSNLTDHVARHGGAQFDQDIIPHTQALPEHLLARLHLGWNIAQDDKIEALSRTLAPPRPGAQRGIDISCRAAVPPSAWIHPLRERLIQVLEPAPAGLRVLTPRDRVSQAQYYDEMLDSRICVSPFGYGELCWRDFEAILCGCLLVKPDMGHLRTQPDLFVPGETYVPVAWDYSDLVAVCRRYLADDAARQRIVDTARARLLQALQADWTCEAVGQLLARCRSL